MKNVHTYLDTFTYLFDKFGIITIGLLGILIGIFIFALSKYNKLSDNTNSLIASVLLITVGMIVFIVGI